MLFLLFNQNRLFLKHGVIKIVLLCSPGSVVAKYRIGWEYKDDIESQDLIDADTLKARLDTYLRENNGHLYNYRVPIHSLRAERK